jgi:hypothetical protein
VATSEDHLLARLLRRAHLFDDPAAYEAGVRDALELVGDPVTHDVAGATVAESTGAMVSTA